MMKNKGNIFSSFGCAGLFLEEQEERVDFSSFKIQSI
jgi:hypothetical protein